MKLTTFLLLGGYEGLFEVFVAIVIILAVLFIVNLITSILQLTAASKGTVSTGLKVVNVIFSLLSACIIFLSISAGGLYWLSGLMAVLFLTPIILTIIAFVKERETGSGKA